MQVPVPRRRGLPAVDTRSGAHCTGPTSTAPRDLLKQAAEAGVSRMVYTSSVATLGINRDRTPLR